MAYSAFNVTGVKTAFGLRVDEDGEPFAHVPPVAVSQRLLDDLAEYVPLAIRVNTEKARSELIITPILMEVRRQAGQPLSVFSGREFPVDPGRGLNGVCDFLVGLSPEQFDVEAPVVVVTEAKNGDLPAGMGQCMAGMVAARLFNEQQGRPVERVFGCVTSGSLWRFLDLHQDLIRVEAVERYLPDIGRIVGILVWMVRSLQVPQAAPA